MSYEVMAIDIVTYDVITYDIICNDVLENPGVLTVMFLKQFEYGIEKHNLRENKTLSEENPSLSQQPCTTTVDMIYDLILDLIYDKIGYDI